jgi:hypothetical protein
VQLPKRSFEIIPAKRHNVPLLFGVFAIWDGGKTVSGIRVGRGMTEVLSGDPDSLHVIDTEGNRALAYADQFRFQHVPFAPPHGSLDYLAAISQCVSAGAKVIMVDTVTHEHYGIGGYLDTIEAAQAELVKRWRMPDTPQSLDKVKFSAINVAASKRKELVRNIEQLGRAGVALIFCFRASEKVRPRKKGQQGGEGDDSKMVEMGYMPDTKESLMFLMTASALLMPRAKGVPTWKPEKPGEQLMVKMPGYFEGIFHDGEQLNEEQGRRMALWAKGSDAPPGRTPSPAKLSLEDRAAAVLTALREKKTRKGLDQAYTASAGLREELVDAGRGMLLDQIENTYSERCREMPLPSAGEGVQS